MAFSASAIRAGLAYVELGLKDNQLVRGLNAASAKLRAFGASLTAIGAKVAGLGAALATPFLYAAREFAEDGSKLKDLSEQLNISVEALSGLIYAAQQSGSSAEDLQKALKTMVTRVIDAARGSDQARKSFARLGLTIDDLSGLSPDEQFKLIAERLVKVVNPANRARIAMEIFGDDAIKLLGLLSSGAKGIEELAQEAQRLGLIMSTEDAESASALNSALSALLRALRRVIVEIGGALAPLLRQAADWITNVAASIGDWIRENQGWIVTAAAVTAGIIALGVAITALGATLSAIGTVIGGISALFTALAGAIGLTTAALGALLSPLGLVVAAVGGITAGILAWTTEGKRATDTLVQGFNDVAQTAMDAFGGIKEALAAGDLQGAMEVAWLGLKAVWYQGVAALKASWRQFRSFFVELFWDAVYGVARALLYAWTAIKMSFSSVINFIEKSWVMSVAVIKMAINDLVASFQRAWARIKNPFNSKAQKAAIEEANRELKEANRKIVQEVAEKRQKNQQEIEKIRMQGQQELEALTKMQEEEKRARREEIERLNAEDQKKVEAARAELQQKLEELRKPKPLPEGGPEGERKDKEKPKRKPEFDLRGLDETQKKVEVRGAFNPFAVAGLGATKLMERTAAATEKVAENTKKILKHAEDGKLVFV